MATKTEGAKATTKTTTKAVTTGASAEVLAQLAAMFPQGDTYNRTKFPKLVFKSQTVLDDEENVKVKAGTFFTERETEETDEKGKPVWDSVELGKTLDGHIVYYRLRLQYWDKDEEVFYTTPMYDNAHDVVPLFKAGDFVAQGTPAELKAMYPTVITFKDKKTGEPKDITVSKLREAYVLYIIKDGELLELTIGGTSGKSFKTYLGKFAPQSCITTFNSTKEEAGSTKWNMMSFKPLRNPTQEEAVLAVNTIEELREAIEHEKQYYASKRASASTAGVASTPLVGAGAALALDAVEKNEDADTEVVAEDDDF